MLPALYPVVAMRKGTSRILKAGHLHQPKTPEGDLLRLRTTRPAELVFTSTEVEAAGRLG
jgi:hypothetical protein